MLWKEEWMQEELENQLPSEGGHGSTSGSNSSGFKVKKTPLSTEETTDILWKIKESPLGKSLSKIKCLDGMDSIGSGKDSSGNSSSALKDMELDQFEIDNFDFNNTKDINMAIQRFEKMLNAENRSFNTSFGKNPP